VLRKSSEKIALESFIKGPGEKSHKKALKGGGRARKPTPRVIRAESKLCDALKIDGFLDEDPNRRENKKRRFVRKKDEPRLPSQSLEKPLGKGGPPTVTPTRSKTPSQKEDFPLEGGSQRRSPSFKGAVLRRTTGRLAIGRGHGGLFRGPGGLS